MADGRTTEGRRATRKLPKPLIFAALALALLIGWWLLRDDGRADETRFTGYVVSDNVYLASPIAGAVAWVGVERGQQVTAGTALFRIDPSGRSARLEEARAQVSASSAQVGEQQAALARSRADLAAAEAEAGRIGAELSRLSAADRDKPGAVAGLELDQIRLAHRAALRRRDAARTGLTAAAAAIRAADARVAQSRAGASSAEAELAELAPVAPAAGRVEDVMFRAGEWAAANAPVVSIVPLDKVKLRFYVPQAVVNAYRPGTKVAVACDACPQGMTARVDFVASRPEFTPPVIYSLETRDKLVFLVEAVPSNPKALTPGQPVDVTPFAGKAAR